MTTLTKDKYFSVILEKISDTYKGGNRICTAGKLAIRNVSAKRGDEGHHAHIEASISTYYKTRSDYRHVSFVLTREMAIALAAELLLFIDGDI